MKTASKDLQLHLRWNNPSTGETHERWIDSLPLTIGRAPSLNIIVVNDKQVSRQHVKLDKANGKILLIDQNSTNGTFVQGQRIKRVMLEKDVSFQIGPINFVGASIE